MDEKARIRLECLKLAERAQASGDRRPLMDIASEYLDWIVRGVTPRQRTPAPEPDDTPLFSRSFSGAHPRTIKDMIVEVVSDAEPHGLTALEILARIQERWFPGLMRTSLSPQLSRLKSTGKIYSEKGLYRLRTQNASSETDEAFE